MEKDTKEIFDKLVQEIASAFEINVSEVHDALFKMKSFDKTISMCFVAKELGIPLWEAVFEGKEPMDYWYNKINKSPEDLWTSNSTFH